MINMRADNGTSTPTPEDLDFQRSGPGARWWSLDIHAHSPASKDYGADEGKDEDDAPKPTFQAWVQAYLNAGIDGLVITDHNTSEGFQLACEALAEIKAHDPLSADLTIFPGVELTITNGVHILAIFDPTTPVSTVNDLIARCQYYGTRGASTQTANTTVLDAARYIDELGGLCVPAHADKPAGIFSKSQLDFPTLTKSGIVAAEI